MKETFRDAEIKVEPFKQKDGVRALPLKISASVTSYGTILKYLNYVESLRLPKFNIGQMSINKEDTGKVTMSIAGNLAMPPIGVKTKVKTSGRTARHRRR